MAPIRAHAKISSTCSMRFGRIVATRSPFVTPSFVSPAASRSARSCISANVRGTPSHSTKRRSPPAFAPPPNRSGPATAPFMSPNGWRAVTRIVLDGTFFCCREFGRRHIATKTPGTIVNIGASYSWTGGPGFAHSAAAKAGVKNLTETLAVEWAPYGIRVNYLVPGLIPHDDEPEQIRNVPGRGERDALSVPAGRGGAPRELCWGAAVLPSPHPPYNTRATP